MRQASIHSRLRIGWNQDVVDVVIAVAAVLVSLLAIATGGNAVSPLAVAGILAMNLPLAVRRRYPVGVLIACGTVTVAYYWLSLPSAAGDIAVVVAYYTVVTHRSREVAIRAGILTAAGATAALLPTAVAHGSEGGAALLVSWLGYALILVFGDNLRMRRLHLQELEERAERLEQERQDEAWLAVAAERGRIARELHDVVAHHVSVMVVQAGGARRIADTDPAAAKAALLTIEGAGRTALTEMRRMLAVLRADEPGIAPQPSLTGLQSLLDRVRDAGVPVEATIEGEPRELAAGIDLAAYRIVQEALTNAVKHGGPGARATVRLHYWPDLLEIEVLDDGRGALVALRSHDGAGHGLIGMRERAGLYGGLLEAGPRLAGGYRVWATLHYEQGPAESAEAGGGFEAARVPIAAAAGLAERHAAVRSHLRDVTERGRP